MTDAELDAAITKILFFLRDDNSVMLASEAVGWLFRYHKMKDQDEEIIAIQKAYLSGLELAFSVLWTGSNDPESSKRFENAVISLRKSRKIALEIVNKAPDAK